MKVVAIIQARMGSSRLPGKVLKDLAGEPMLSRVIHRVQRASTVDQVIVATTTEVMDHAIAALGEREGWSVFRGSQDDVLDRYYHAALAHQAEVVVRITSDCPLIDPDVIDQVVGRFLAEGKWDYASNVLPIRTFPRGLDIEVMTFAALHRAWQEDQDSAWREHVTPYLYRHPEWFTCGSVTNTEDLSESRWTVDTPEDYEFAQRIYDHFGHDHFSWREVLALLKQHPEWQTINRHIEQKVL
ncbi:MAG: glycosyltransferase family protein [Ardenticatenales bacterium]|nr:glycosyltransferase family protein [Ardenticatenales bacterium]